jgi:hypothetical protein
MYFSVHKMAVDLRTHFIRAQTDKQVTHDCQIAAAAIGIFFSTVRVATSFSTPKVT